MKKLSTFVLRFGLGITFTWFGYLIFKDPGVWGGFIQPWALEKLPLSPDLFMKIIGIFDMIVGVWLIIGFMVWLPAFLAFTHLTMALVATSSGFENVIIRDIGLSFASLSLFLRKFGFGGKK